MNDTPWAFGERSPTPENSPGPLPASVRRPGMLTTICIVGIVLGVIGSMVASFGLLSAVFSKQLQQLSTIPNQAAQKDSGLNQQLELNKSMYSVVNQYRYVNIGLSVVHLCLAVLLVIASIKALGLHESGRTLLSTICLAVSIFEVLRIIGMVAMQLSMMSAMSQVVTPGGDAMRSMVVAMQWVGMVVGLIWFAIKIGLFLFVWFYLRRPAVKALFSPA